MHATLFWLLLLTTTTIIFSSSVNASNNNGFALTAVASSTVELNHARTFSAGLGINYTEDVSNPHLYAAYVNVYDSTGALRSFITPINFDEGKVSRVNLLNLGLAMSDNGARLAVLSSNSYNASGAFDPYVTLYHFNSVTDVYDSQTTVFGTDLITGSSIAGYAGITRSGTLACATFVDKTSPDTNSKVVIWRLQTANSNSAQALVQIQTIAIPSPTISGWGDIGSLSAFGSVLVVGSGVTNNFAVYRWQDAVGFAFEQRFSVAGFGYLNFYACATGNRIFALGAGGVDVYDYSATTQTWTSTSGAIILATMTGPGLSSNDQGTWVAIATTDNNTYTLWQDTSNGTITGGVWTQIATLPHGAGVTNPALTFQGLMTNDQTALSADCSNVLTQEAQFNASLSGPTYLQLQNLSSLTTSQTCLPATQPSLYPYFARKFTSAELVALLGYGDPNQTLASAAVSVTSDSTGVLIGCFNLTSNQTFGVILNYDRTTSNITLRGVIAGSVFTDYVSDYFSVRLSDSKARAMIATAPGIPGPSTTSSTLLYRWNSITQVYDLRNNLTGAPGSELSISQSIDLRRDGLQAVISAQSNLNATDNAVYVYQLPGTVDTNADDYVLAQTIPYPGQPTFYVFQVRISAYGNTLAISQQFNVWSMYINTGTQFVFVQQLSLNTTVNTGVQWSMALSASGTTVAISYERQTGPVSLLSQAVAVATLDYSTMLWSTNYSYAVVFNASASQWFFGGLAIGDDGTLLATPLYTSPSPYMPYLFYEMNSANATFLKYLATVPAPLDPHGASIEQSYAIDDTHLMTADCQLLFNSNWYFTNITTFLSIYETGQTCTPMAQFPRFVQAVPSSSIVANNATPTSLPGATVAITSDGSAWIEAGFDFTNNQTFATIVTYNRTSQVATSQATLSGSVFDDFTLTQISVRMSDDRTRAMLATVPNNTALAHTLVYELNATTQTYMLRLNKTTVGNLVPGTSIDMTRDGLWMAIAMIDSTNNTNNRVEVYRLQSWHDSDPVDYTPVQNLTTNGAAHWGYRVRFSAYYTTSPGTVLVVACQYDYWLVYRSTGNQFVFEQQLNATIVTVQIVYMSVSGDGNTIAVNFFGVTGDVALSSYNNVTLTWTSAIILTSADPVNALLTGPVPLNDQGTLLGVPTQNSSAQYQFFGLYQSLVPPNWTFYGQVPPPTALNGNRVYQGTMTDDTHLLTADCALLITSNAANYASGLTQSTTSYLTIYATGVTCTPVTAPIEPPGIPPVFAPPIPAPVPPPISPPVPPPVTPPIGARQFRHPIPTPIFPLLLLLPPLLLLYHNHHHFPPFHRHHLHPQHRRRSRRPTPSRTIKSCPWAATMLVSARVSTGQPPPDPILSTRAPISSSTGTMPTTFSTERDISPTRARLRYWMARP